MFITLISLVAKAKDRNQMARESSNIKITVQKKSSVDSKAYNANTMYKTFVVKLHTLSAVIYLQQSEIRRKL